MKKVLISGGLGILAVIVGVVLTRVINPTPTPPTPTPVVVQNINQEQPTSIPSPTPMWRFTVSPNSEGSVTLGTTLSQPGYYYTTVIAHVENQASDGDTHDLLASAFHLYPVNNGATDFTQPETLSSPLSSTDYTIAHNTNLDITLIFLVPLNSNRFEISLDGASSGGWDYSVMPPG